jgi:hypothetical protein
MFPGNEPTPLQNWREEYHVRFSFMEGPGETQYVATQGSEDTNEHVVACPSKAPEKQQESQQPSRTRKYQKSKSKLPVKVYYAQQRDYSAISQAKKRLMSTNEWLQATPSDRTRLEKLSKQSVIKNRYSYTKSKLLIFTNCLLGRIWESLGKLWPVKKDMRSIRMARLIRTTRSVYCLLYFR